ncbi:hypothetical protein [Staphylococcus phage PT94]
MDAKQLKESLSMNDIYSLLDHLGASPFKEKGHLRATTICHGGDSSKLYYYPEQYIFNCFTHCHSMDIYEFIQKVKGVDFKEAFDYVKNYFNITETESTVDMFDRVDMSFFNKFNKIDQPIKPLPEVDKSILNVYNDEYHISWVRDYIMPQTMRKFNIKLDILNQRIIIPTLDDKGRLIGIRARNLDKDMVDKGFKYMPLKHNNKLYNFPMGSVLYGLYQNQHNIESVKKVILFESEKSVLALDSFYNGKGIGVAVGGSSFSDIQSSMIEQLDIDECIIAFDKEFSHIGDKMEKYYANKIQRTIADKLQGRCNISVIWDMEGLLDEKDSPVDKGFDVFYKLWKNRILISDIEK